MTETRDNPNTQDPALDPAQVLTPMSWPKRSLLALVVGACLVGIVWGLSGAQSNPTLVTPAVIETLTPLPGSLTVPKQSPIVVDFTFGWTGELRVNGTDIPVDQTVYDRPRGVLTFVPGEAKVLERLPGGSLTATVFYWPVGSSRETEGQAFSWTFDVS